jgi:hypothetical protein
MPKHQPLSINSCDTSKLAASAVWSAFSQYLVAIMRQKAAGRCKCHLCAELLEMIRKAEPMLFKYQKAMGLEPIYFPLPNNRN